MELGDTVKDTATGYTGVLTARTTYIGGRMRLLVEAPGENRKPIEQWFDEARVVVVAAQSVMGLRPVANESGNR